MKCVYCDSKLEVSNSRFQKRLNQVWRRRHCPNCDATITTVEQVDLAKSVRFVDQSEHIQPFSRTKLLISLYESCKHRNDAYAVAEALTDTVMQRLKPVLSTATVQRAEIITCAQETLKHFDHAAATAYSAYHTH